MRLLCLMAITLCLAVNVQARQSQSVIQKLLATPANFNRGTGLEIEPVLLTDTDHDYEFQYRWFINGVENIFETSASFPSDAFERGDKLSVEVIPFTLEGIQLKSFISPQLIVANAPPVITTEPPDKLSGNVLTYQVEATDPDDDPVTFRLENASEGITIDSTSGTFVCNLEKHLEATSFSVIIVAEDNFGGRTEQRFKLDLSYVEIKGKTNE